MDSGGECGAWPPPADRLECQQDVGIGECHQIEVDLEFSRLLLERRQVVRGNPHGTLRRSVQKIRAS
jgi:hypothetical protein